MCDGGCHYFRFLDGKKTYKGTKIVAKTIYDHRGEIAGAGIGIIRGSIELAKDSYGHTIREKDFTEQLNILKKQSERYQYLNSRYYWKMGKMGNSEGIDY